MGLTQKNLVNRMLHPLAAIQRQKFYEEYSRLLTKGCSDEEAVGGAFEKIGIANPFTSMKITLDNEVLFGVFKKKRK